MSTVAEQLRLGREAKSLSIQQVAEITKMRSDHLVALEEGNFDVFSAPVFVRGFVRTYATLLKLDVPAVMAALDAELKSTPRFAEPPSLSGRPRGFLDILTLQFAKVDWRKGVLFAAVLILAGVGIVGYLAWDHYRKRDPLKGLKPGIYQPPTNRPAGETLPLPGDSRKR